MTALSLELEYDCVREYVETKSERAANEFVRNYRKFVYATALRYTGDYDDADDIAQEVFIRALNGLSNFNGKSSIKSWLYRITINLSFNFNRKKKLRNFFSLSTFNHEVDFPDIASSPDKVLANKEYETYLLKMLSKLPEKQRETFALRYFDELSYEEISNMLGTSVGGLKANYHQAVKKLSLFIKEND